MVRSYLLIVLLAVVITTCHGYRQKIEDEIKNDPKFAAQVKEIEEMLLNDDELEHDEIVIGNDKKLKKDPFFSTWFRRSPVPIPIPVVCITSPCIGGKK